MKAANTTLSLGMHVCMYVCMYVCMLTEQCSYMQLILDCFIIRAGRDDISSAKKLEIIAVQLL